MQQFWLEKDELMYERLGEWEMDSIIQKVAWTEIVPLFHLYSPFYLYSLLPR